ncbi:MAG TPA: ester cyclase [Terracidiphilus sp.]|nr:ester cyclase [Terracidiphilus sp.]
MSQPNQTIDQNKQVVQRFIEECWNKGNLNSISEYLSDRVHFHDPAFPNMATGLQGARNHIDGCRKGFPDMKITIDDTIAERNEVVVHWTVRGTHQGQFLGMQPTHKKVAIDGTSIFRLEGSKIAETHASWNVASLMGQLGIAEVPKEAMATAGAR